MPLPRIKELRAYVKRAAGVDQGRLAKLHRADWVAAPPLPSLTCRC